MISLGEITGGAAPNVIPNEVYIQGTIRSFQDDVRKQLAAEVENVFKLSEQMGGSYEFRLTNGYPVMVNDGRVNNWMREVAREMVAETAVVDVEFGMGAEDFSYMTREAKGAMFMLGAAIDDGIVRNHHTDIFDIDENVLPLGTAVLAETAHRFVTGKVR